jgi:hypothetical protein
MDGTSTKRPQIYRTVPATDLPEKLFDIRYNTERGQTELPFLIGTISVYYWTVLSALERSVMDIIPSLNGNF